MASPKFVLYHQDWCPPKKFAVLKEYADGTVDIGPEGKPPVVTECVVLEEPKPGHCTAFEDKKKPAKEADKEPAK